MENDPYQELEIYLKNINNEISEVFDKLHVTGNNCCNAVIDTADSGSDVLLSKLQPVNSTKERKPSLRKLSSNGAKSNGIDEWSSLAQFEKFINLEMENLAAAENQKTNGTSHIPTSSQTTKPNNNNILKPEKHVTIPLQSFSNKAKCITNMNNCHDDRNKNGNSKKPPIYTKSIRKETETSDEHPSLNNNGSEQTAITPISGTKVKDGWSSDDSILKSIDEDNKSTSSSVSTSSAFEDSANLYSEKSESSMSSINNILNKVNDESTLRNNKKLTNNSKNNGTNNDIITNSDLKTMEIDSHDQDDALEVLSSYDNDSGNDEFDEKGDGFNNFSYSSSDSKTTPTDPKFRNYFNSLPLMRAKKQNQQQHNVYSSFNSVKRKYFNSIDQEPFRDDIKIITNLPSPSLSCGSWSSDSNAMLQQSLCTKSSSVPTLVKKNQSQEDVNKLTVLRNSRSHSDRYLCEIQAAEAMKWLREAGFPQYAHMYEDLQFPIDLSCVERDHPFLEKDQLHALYRRLVILNRSAAMRLDGQYTRNVNKRREDSDEDVCALSENWKFQPEIRRWSRVGEMGPLSLNLLKAAAAETSKTTSRESSPEEFEIKVPHGKLATVNYLSVPPPAGGQDNSQVNLKRSGSERLRDGAKNILRRVESIKSRRKKRKNREGVVISGPTQLDIMQIHHKFQDLKCRDIKTSRSNTTSPTPMSPVSTQPNPLFLFADPKICPTSDNGFALGSFGQHLLPHIKAHPASRTSPLHFFSQKKPAQADDSSSYCSEVSQDSSNGSADKKLSPTNRFFQKHTKRDDDAGVLSDSEAFQTSRQKKKLNKNQKSTAINRGGGSLNLGKDSNRYRENLKSKRIFRSKSAVRHSTENDKSQDVTLRASNSGSVVRWHSFRAQTTTKRDFQLEGVSLCKLSCGQIEKLRKLALITLTGYMERYCPTHRSGWNWELPKFIKKIKAPDYKDKKVFGVPFSIALQKTGHTLPKGIQAALTWLKINALDQVGIFRKSGVKSRIAKLKIAIEQTDENIIKIFEDQQAYDVADVVKQYFRDLPESLLSTKLSETFVAIFQFLPTEVIFEALQSAVLLLPDEHREVLLMLLEFLNIVAEKSRYNQMSASNLALCLAPSIFQNGVHSNTPNASPRRRKPTGLPDSKDLDENRASTQCLTFLIQNYKKVYHISSEKINRCNFSYMEESRPVTLEALNLGDTAQLSNWRLYLYECIKATVKEGREKSRGWFNVNSLDPNIEISYRKVGDGHPLRLWKITTEVEASPLTILNRITKERHLWDKQLLKMRVIEDLDSTNDIFQYACSSGHIITDYCVLRSFCTDLPKGAHVSVEISIEHPGASLLMMGSVRGVVLASRYLIEPIGNGRSKLMHLARVDTKGRTIGWYNKQYGYLCALNLARIRDGLKT